MTAISTIFVSSAGSNAFLPVISEMRKPKDYNKAVYVCSMLSPPLSNCLCYSSSIRQCIAEQTFQ